MAGRARGEKRKWGRYCQVLDAVSVARKVYRAQDAGPDDEESSCRAYRAGDCWPATPANT